MSSNFPSLQPAMTVLVCIALARFEESQVTHKMQVEIGGPLSVGMTVECKQPKYGDMTHL